jgi:hypothetical protein
MNRFAERTGITSDSSGDRYLWTDSFAACNFIGLYRATGNSECRDLCHRLIREVHWNLGRHREDDPREGWISGLEETEGAEHPTRGGLRIGKPLPERAEGAPLNSRMEWERDGQYFHYLTRWMHALDLAARNFGEIRYMEWGCELLHNAGNAFVYIGRNGEQRMYWKMSVDLSRALVESMGQLDPLDGFITSEQIRGTVRAYGTEHQEMVPAACGKLEEQSDLFLGILRRVELETTDPLGIGGLLIEATRLMQLIGQGSPVSLSLFRRLLKTAESSLHQWSSTDPLDHPASSRLPFRELGLAIGLKGIGLIKELIPGTPAEPRVQAALQRLDRYLPLADHITSFWCESGRRDSPGWKQHRNINSVMLATALEPRGFLVLTRPGSGRGRSRNREPADE